MARLYSNVNDRFRHSNFGRVTNQEMHKVQNLTTPSAEVIAAEEIRSEAQVTGEVRQAKHVLRELARVRSVMDARPDKRRRPEGVSKEAFKLYRELKLKPLTSKKKRNHPAK